MNNEFQLISIANKLCLHKGLLPADSLPNKSNYIFVDFESSEWSHRLKSNSKELLAQAIGLNKGMKSVLDLTCGLGQDAFLLSYLGLEVTAIEKSKDVYELVKDALARTEKSQFQLVHCDSATYLDQLSDSVDVIYIDPMFPEKKKSSLPSKEMQFLQSLLDDSTGDGLLTKALSKDCKRLVVKRHLRSDYLDGVKPSFQIKAKAVRFDIYIKPS